MTARFWTWINGGWVKVSVRSGDVFWWSKGYRTDEGYNATAQRWSHEGDRVSMEVVNNGRDCDGYTSHHAEYFCQVTKAALTGDEAGDGTRIPMWTKSSCRVYDQYAQMSGY